MVQNLFFVTLKSTIICVYRIKTLLLKVSYTFQEVYFMSNIKEIAGKVLGERTGEYKTYSPEVLVPVPRNLSIEYLGVKMENLSGAGFDLWYSYEFRCLTNTGLPVASVIKFVIPHTSQNIIESKSFKLYCNGFTTERLGDTKQEALKKACKIMQADLSKAAGGNVEVSVVDSSKRLAVFKNYKELTELVDPKIEIKVYHEDPSLLEVEDTNELKEYRLKFDALRSTCRITKQADTGSMYLFYCSKKHIKEESLVKYFTSFYEEHHFHEEILITAFTRLEKLLNPEDSLFITALYQRRGSLDIGPCHYKNLNFGTEEEDIIENLGKAESFSYDPNNLYR